MGSPREWIAASLKRACLLAGIPILLLLSSCVIGIFFACDTDNECAVDQFCDVGGVCVFFDTCPGCVFEQIDGAGPSSDQMQADDPAPESPMSP